MFARKEGGKGEEKWEGGSGESNLLARLYRVRCKIAAIRVKKRGLISGSYDIAPSRA